MTDKIETERDERGHYKVPYPGKSTLGILRQARREYGAFGSISGETLAQIDEALRLYDAGSPEHNVTGSVRQQDASPESRGEPITELGR